MLLNYINSKLIQELWVIEVKKFSISVNFSQGWPCDNVDKNQFFLVF